MTALQNQLIVAEAQCRGQLFDQRQLAVGDSVLIGSSASCGWKLDDASISSMHCFLRVEEDGLVVEAWQADSPTLVDDNAIEQECRFGFTSTLTVGQFRITFRVESVTEDNMDEDAADGASEWDDRPPQPDNAHRHSFDRTQTAESSFAPRNVHSDVTHRSHANDGETFATGTIAEETLDLLRAEIETLQSELAERDARLIEIESCGSDTLFDLSESDAITDGEAQCLTQRVDELLNELAVSDQRQRELEDLLQLTEEAARAEQEERTQIEVWVGEIEQRIGERQAEWQAEMESLQQRFTQVQTEHQEAEQRLAETVSQKALDSHERTILDLRKRLSKVQDVLANTQKERDGLLTKLESVEIQSTIERQTQIVEHAIREEQVKMAQERAAFSRQKAELVRRIGELEVQLRERPDLTDADMKIRAFRDHLRDIDASRETVKDQRSLATRLSDLWKRLDG
ncbi:MAG: FHA domain-containing protein [Pirellulaceae bacterium]